MHADADDAEANAITGGDLLEAGRNWIGIKNHARGSDEGTGGDGSGLEKFTAIPFVIFHGGSFCVPWWRKIIYE